MSEHSEASIAMQEGQTPVEQPSLQKEYGRCIQTLSRTGLVSLLPGRESLGVVGFDGKEYAVPTPSEITDIFDRNKELVEEKREQGFTRLQLTPFAMPLAVMKDRAQAVILKHAKEGKILQAKRNPTDPDVPIQVNPDEPVWMWDEYLTGEQNGNLLYLPRSFSSNHQGLTKPAVVERADICAVPGWSVGLVEDTPFLPREGQGVTRGGRRQPENNRTPQEYLRALAEAQYKGETGWTPEDLLTNFVTRLEETDQVSNDWDDSSAAWLTGAYFQQEGAVPIGYWNRGGRRLRLDGGSSGIRASSWGAPSTVRLES